jgi:hypothetical protein
MKKLKGTKFEDVNIGDHFYVHGVEYVKTSSNEATIRECNKKSLFLLNEDIDFKVKSKHKLKHSIIKNMLFWDINI